MQKVNFCERRGLAHETKMNSNMVWVWFCDRLKSACCILMHHHKLSHTLPLDHHQSILWINYTKLIKLLREDLVMIYS